MRKLLTSVIQGKGLEWTALVPAVALMFLFVYTGTDKVINYYPFHATLKQSFLLKDFAEVIAVALPIFELVIAAMFLVGIGGSRRLLRYAFLTSVITLSLFTIYLIYMVNFGGDLPCSCGGVIATMSWSHHILFNMGCICAAGWGLWKLRKKTPATSIATLQKSPI